MRTLSLLLIVVCLLGCVAATPSPVTVLTITTASLPVAVRGKSYMTQLTAAGGTAPYKWSVVAGQLPPGVTLGQSGTLAGTPVTAGSSVFTIQVVDSAAALAQIQIRGDSNETL